MTPATPALSRRIGLLVALPIVNVLAALFIAGLVMLVIGENP